MHKNVRAISCLFRNNSYHTFSEPVKEDDFQVDTISGSIVKCGAPAADEYNLFAYIFFQLVQYP